MTMKPVSLTLVFENCDSVTIPMEYVRAFAIAGISPGLSYDTNLKKMQSFTSIDKMYILFRSSFGVSKIETAFEDNAFERINKHKDITHLIITYDNDTKVEYSVEWPPEENTALDNSRQHNTKHCDGLLVQIYP